MSAQPTWVKFAGAVSLIVVIAIYLFRLDRVVGLFVDDAWYALLAKALGTGQGYSLLNSPTPHLTPLYPPAYPFLLSLLYRISPDFPDNIWLLKLVSIGAMIAMGGIAYRYFSRDRETPTYVALGIAAAAALCPPLVLLATSSLMSECLFTFAFLLTVAVVERCVREGKGPGAWKYAVMAGAVASFAFLTRSIAISLIAAAFVYLLKERLFRSAFIFTVVVVILSSPWVIYSRLHQPTRENQLEQGYVVYPYTTQFWQRLAGYSGDNEITIGELPGRVWHNVVEVVGRDIGRAVATPVFEAIINSYQEADRFNESGVRTNSPLLFCLILSALAIAGWVFAASRKLTLAEIAVPFSLTLTVLWPWETFRFVLPLVPFVIFYILLGFAAIQWLSLSLRGKGMKAETRPPWKLMGAFGAAIIAVCLYGNVGHILSKYSSSPLERPRFIQTFEAAEEMFKWMDREVPQDALVATPNPAMVYLYTGNKSIAWEDAKGRWEFWNRLGVRYLTWVSIFPIPPDPAEKKYRLVYQSRDNSVFRVIDLGPVESRAVWGK